jgi:hypothetical protein
MNTTESIPTPYFDEGGIGRFSGAEISLLRTAFAKNKDVFIEIKRVFLQQEVKGESLARLKALFFGNTALVDVLKRNLLPDPSEPAKIGDQAHLWLDRKYENLLATETKILVLARKDTIRFFKEGLERLQEIAETGESEARPLVIDLDMRADYENKSPEEVKRAIVAFSDAVEFLERSLASLSALSDTKAESSDEKAKRAKQDSSE